MRSWCMEMKIEFKKAENIGAGFTPWVGKWGNKRTESKQT